MVTESGCYSEWAAKHLPEALYPETLAVIRQIQDKSARSGTLRGLAEHCPNGWIMTLLEEARALQHGHIRAEVISALLLRLALMYSPLRPVGMGSLQANRSQYLKTSIRLIASMMDMGDAIAMVRRQRKRRGQLALSSSR